MFYNYSTPIKQPSTNTNYFVFTNMDAQKRLLQERDNWRRDRPYGFVAKPQLNKKGILDMYKWSCSFPGPEGSPFEGLTLSLNLVFYDSYPVMPPDAIFTTPIYHPNVYPDGYICSNILSTEWSPSLNIKLILLSIRNLIANPNISSAANLDAAEAFSNHPDMYKEIVRNTFSAGISTKKEVLQNRPSYNY